MWPDATYQFSTCPNHQIPNVIFPIYIIPYIAVNTANYVAPFCQSTTATMAYTAFQIAPSSRTAPPL